jgi:hypothetical protein
LIHSMTMNLIDSGEDTIEFLSRKVEGMQ